MRTSTTSCLSSAALSALRDEFEKIADAERNAKLKRWLKNSAIIAAGTGAGTGAALLTNEGLKRAIGPQWRSLSPTMRKAILAPAVGITSIGAAHAFRRLLEESHKDE